MSYKFIIEETFNGSKTLVATDDKRVYLHSKYDPLKEAENIISKYELERYDYFILLGLGLGYVLDKLKKIVRGKIFVIEKSEEIFKIYKENFQPPDNVVFFINKIPEEIINAILSDFNIKKNKGVIIIEIPSIVRLFPDYYKNLKIKLNEELNNLINYQMTLLKLFIPVINNFRKNLNLLNKFKIIKINTSLAKEQVAVIAGAGPSLEDDIEDLKRIKDYVYIFAVDSAVKFLLYNKIIPDFIFSVDPQYYAVLHFNNFDMPEKSFLILDLFSNFVVVRKFKNIGLIISKNFISDFLFKDFPYLMDSNSGSVTNYIYQFVEKCGFGKIIFSGLDLSYNIDKMYVRGSYVNQFYLKRMNKFKNLNSLYFDFYNNRARVEISFGEKKFFTSHSMIQYYEWLKNNVKKNNIFLSYNCNVTIEGVVKVRLSELKLNVPKNKIYEIEKFNDDYINEITNRFRNGVELQNEIDKLIKFCKD